MEHQGCNGLLGDPAADKRPCAKTFHGHRHGNDIVADMASELDCRHAPIIKEPLEPCARGDRHELEWKGKNQNTQEAIKTVDLHPPGEQPRSRLRRVRPETVQLAKEASTPRDIRAQPDQPAVARYTSTPTCFAC